MYYVCRYQVRSSCVKMTCIGRWEFHKITWLSLSSPFTINRMLTEWKLLLFKYLTVPFLPSPPPPPHFLLWLGGVVWGEPYLVVVSAALRSGLTPSLVLGTTSCRWADLVSCMQSESRPLCCLSGPWSTFSSWLRLCKTSWVKSGVRKMYFCPVFLSHALALCQYRASRSSPVYLLRSWVQVLSV